MAPLQIPQNFKFKPIFLVLSHFQNEGTPSSTQHIPISFKERSSIILLFNIACEDMSKHIPQRNEHYMRFSKNLGWLDYPIAMAKIYH
jgi:hypothetical protein